MVITYLLGVYEEGVGLRGGETEYHIETELGFFENLYENCQKMKVNTDGTISPFKAPDLVFGITECSSK